jgi:hypothetical protein
LGGLDDGRVEINAIIRTQRNTGKVEEAMSELLIRPVELTDAELDAVAGGQLLNLAFGNLVNIQDVNLAVAVPISAAVAVAVLGTALAAAGNVTTAIIQM